MMIITFSDVERIAIHARLLCSRFSLPLGRNFISDWLGYITKYIQVNRGVKMKVTVKSWILVNLMRRMQDATNDL